ncbi:MAG: hypothetical protein IJO48_04760 [Clostridia bacterium]|nr:hypothetical protein [Clostridia bacterium]
MIGYVSADKNELKVRELADYNACYCGLCKSISSRYGQVARLTLSYDCAFIAMLVCGLNGERAAKKQGCVYKPLAKKRIIAEDSPSFQFAADLEIALAYYKLADDWNDEKKLMALFEKAGLYASFKKLNMLSRQLGNIVKDGIYALSKLEKEKCGEIDAVANTFAKILGDAAYFAPLNDEKQKKVLSHVLYSIGRWVYLCDAWDDRKKDEKSGSYNPFVICGKQHDDANASFLLNNALNKAIDAYDLIEIKTHKGVLDNIMYIGCVAKTKEVLGGKHEQSL